MTQTSNKITEKAAKEIIKIAEESIIATVLKGKVEELLPPNAEITIDEQKVILELKRRGIVACSEKDKFLAYLREVLPVDFYEYSKEYLDRVIVEEIGYSKELV